MQQNCKKQMVFASPSCYTSQCTTEKVKKEFWKKKRQKNSWNRFTFLYFTKFLSNTVMTIFCCWRKKTQDSPVSWLEYMHICDFFFVNCVRKNNCGTNGDPECVSCQIFFWKQVLSKYYFILLTYYYYNYYITTHFFDSVNEKRTDFIWW